MHESIPSTLLKLQKADWISHGVALEYEAQKIGALKFTQLGALKINTLALMLLELEKDGQLTWQELECLAYFARSSGGQSDQTPPVPPPRGRF